MKKKLSIIIALLSLTFTISAPAFAQTSSPSSDKSLKNLEVNYETMLGHKGRNHDQLVQELLNDGLSVKDADYYADLDILVNQIELQNISIDTDLKNAQKLSDQYARINPDELREQALAMDPSALKTILAQNDAMSFGKKDAQQVIQTLKKNNNGYNITIEYPDGSKFIQSSNTVEKQPESSAVKTNTYVSGPWNSSSKFSSNYSIATPNRYVTTAYWQYTSGNSYAKVEDVFTWDFANSPTYKVTYVSDTGASSYSGVVTIGTEYLSNHVGTSSSDPNIYIQGYTDVRFQVSGSFSASFAGMGISVSGGAGWHEYCVTEVDGIADVYNWAAQFI